MSNHSNSPSQGMDYYNENQSKEQILQALLALYQVDSYIFAVPIFCSQNWKIEGRKTR